CGSWPAGGAGSVPQGAGGGHPDERPPVLSVLHTAGTEPAAPHRAVLTSRAGPRGAPHCPAPGQGGDEAVPGSSYRLGRGLLPPSSHHRRRCWVRCQHVL
ncbi:hypothetical protein HaLaN_28604, partial [Haematococcus lacustris]